MLFNARVVEKSAGFSGIPEIVREISRSNETLVLTGGTSQLPGLASRFASETKTIPLYQAQRPHSCFTGLSILGSMESGLQNLLITSEYFLEEGAARCTRRLLG